MATFKFNKTEAKETVIVATLGYYGFTSSSYNKTFTDIEKAMAYVEKVNEFYATQPATTSNGTFFKTMHIVNAQQVNKFNL